MNIIKGVPQWCILGPLLLNIFMNDIFHFKNKESINNYIDDNRVSYSNKNLVSMKEVLVDGSVASYEWFKNNKKQPDKFQAIMLGKSR